MAEDRIVTPLEIISREQLEALEAEGWEISRPIEFDEDGSPPDWRRTAYELQRRIDEFEDACVEAIGYIEAGESGRSYRILRRAVGAAHSDGRDDA